MTKKITSGPYRTFRSLNPDETYVEFEGSTITIPMKARRSPREPWLEETIKLRAHMRLEIYPPYVNNLGTREFQFTIRDWDLYGKSPMLNRLFFDDPRGKLVVDAKTGFADYVPAVITFTVAHHYRLHVESEGADEVRALFGPDAEIEIRNLTSHHTRLWTPYEELDHPQIAYSNPTNRIYWQIVPPERLKREHLSYLADAMESTGGAAWQDSQPIIAFHSKAPDIPGDAKEFDLGNPQDRARYLLGLGTTNPSRRTGRSGNPVNFLRGILPQRGLEAALVQLRGNTVVSPLYRARQSLDIRLPLTSNVQTAADVGETVKRLLERTKGHLLKGYIQIISPARCLCTAEQAPDPGFDIDSADFPARVTYAANYDIYINDHRFVEDQAGIAVAVGAEETPPVDVKVAFEKPQAGHVASRYLEFSSGDCTGMTEINVDAYYEGLNFARYWRTVPLEPGAVKLRSDNGRFEDYDPAFEY